MTIIEISSAKAVIDAFINRKGHLDFNRIVAMPNDLRGDADRCPLAFAIARWEEGETLPFPLAVWHENFINYLDEYNFKNQERHHTDNLLTRDKTTRDLQKCRQNYNRHGYFSREDFMRKEWGISDTPTLIQRSKNSITIEATDIPYKVLEQLSRNFPSHEIVVKQRREGPDAIKLREHFMLVDGEMKSVDAGSSKPKEFNANMYFAQMNRHVQSVMY